MSGGSYSIAFGEIKEMNVTSPESHSAALEGTRILLRGKIKKVF